MGPVADCRQPHRAAATSAIPACVGTDDTKVCPLRLHGDGAMTSAALIPAGIAPTKTGDR
jgi:predicted membrane protein